MASRAETFFAALCFLPITQGLLGEKWGVVPPIPLRTVRQMITKPFQTRLVAKTTERKEIICFRGPKSQQIAAIEV